MPIKDLIDALSIVISSGKQVSVDSTLDLIEIANMRIETPQELEVMPVELNFLFDARGEWCLSLARQCVLKESVIAPPYRGDKGVLPEFSY